MLKSSDASSGEPEMRVIVSPCAKLIVQSFCRSTSNVTGSRSTSQDLCSLKLGEIRSVQSGFGR